MGVFFSLVLGFFSSSIICRPASNLCFQKYVSAAKQGTQLAKVRRKLIFTNFYEKRSDYRGMQFLYLLALH